MGDSIDDGLGNDAAWSRDVAAAEPIEISFTDAATSTPPPDASDAPRSRRTAMGIAIGLATLVAVVVLANGSDDGDAQREPSEAASPTTLSELPTVPTTNDRPDDAGEVDVDDQLERFPDPSRVIAQSYSALPQVWRNGSIQVPDGAMSIDSMTLVVLTADGNLREVDLPSGSTRDFDIGEPATFFAPRISVGRTATLATTATNRANAAGQPFSLFRAGEQPVDLVVPLQANEIRERPGTDEFIGLGVELAASSLNRLTIDADGALSTVPIRFGPELSRGRLRFGPSGRVLALDGGGVFSHDFGGPATLVAEGELISASSHHVLTRSCTAEYECDGVLVDGMSGEASSVRLDPEFVPSLADGSAQVSPDGNWLRYRSTDLDRVDRLLDLRSGAITSIPGLTSQVADTRDNDVWAPDSSGFFRVREQTLEFYDIATDTVVPFADGPSLIIDFGVRLDITGTPEPPVIADADAGPDLQLVAIDEAGSFHDLDLSTGEVMTFPIRDPRTLFGRSIVVSDGDAAVAVAPGRGPAARLDRVAAVSTELDDPWEAPVHRGRHNDTIWQQIDGDRSDADDDGVVYGLRRMDDTTHISEVRVPPGASVVGGDVSGGLVAVGESADISLLHSESVELLTSGGELLGLGSTAIIVRECGDLDDTCQPTRVDRVTGNRSPIDAPAAADAQAAFDNGFGLIVEDTVSPDGEVLIGPTADGPLDWIITDLVDGSMVEIGSIRTGSRIAWTTDSTHAVFQSSDALFVYERAARRVLELSDAPPIVGFTVR